MQNWYKRVHKLTFFFWEKEKGKGKGKSKGRCRGRYPVRPSHLSLEDRRRRLKAKAECRVCGRKGHWANDRQCAMSFSSSSARNQTRTARLATRQQFTDRANQTEVCFVLHEYSDDPDTSAYMVGQNVPQPKEATEQIPLTPTASAAVDIKNTATFNDRVMDDNDEPWATETDHRTGWNKTFKRAERIVVCCMESSCATLRNRLYHWPKQRTSL